MKHMFFILLTLFPAVLFAEELPVIWVEAGTNQKINLNLPMSEVWTRKRIPVSNPISNSSGYWTLLYEHRVLASGTTSCNPSQIGTIFSFDLKTPSVKEGVTLQAELSFNDVTVRKVVVASQEPFEDRKAWFGKYPVALYDPEGKTAEFFEKEEYPFQHLKSFNDIETVTGRTIIIGEKTSFVRKRGLDKVLYQKMQTGNSVLVVAPVDNFPLDFSDPNNTVYSLSLTENAKHLFPLEPDYWMTDSAWVLQSERGIVILADNNNRLQSETQVLKNRCPGGPRLLDLRLIKGDFKARPTNRMIAVKKSLFDSNIENKYFFRMLIETLNNKQSETHP
ncbi:MAG: hypothetical protein LBQ54_10360 [Planctomycetaceae bacterium]|jgi:hypothetical protein|nr:hypothetical protein [Planctomycetaceae bacterium]